MKNIVCCLLLISLYSLVVVNGRVSYLSSKVSKFNINSNDANEIKYTSDRVDDSIDDSTSSVRGDDDSDEYRGGVILDDSMSAIIDDYDDDQDDDNSDDQDDDDTHDSSYINDECISNVNSNDDNNSENDEIINKANVINNIKDIWKHHVTPSPSPHYLKQLTNVTAISNIRPNGTDKHTLYKQILSQFVNPLNIAGGSSSKTLWLDQEFVLNIKGLAKLAQHPELLKTQTRTGGIFPKGSTRGVKLSLGRSSSSIQSIIAEALSHSLGATAVHLTRKILDSIRQEAVLKKVPKKMLSRSNIISALFEYIEEVDEPFLIVLSDELSWLSNSQKTSDAIIDALKSDSSKTFFLILEPTDDVLEYSSAIKPVTMESTDQNARSTPSSMDGDFDGKLNNNMMNGFNFPPGFFPPGFFPPGIMPPGAMPPGYPVQGRSFQVSVKNGSATVQGMDPMSLPNGGKGGKFISGALPIPPEVMKKILNEQRQKMNQHQSKTNNKQQPQQQQQYHQQHNVNDEMPSLEEMQELMKDPEVQEKMKSFLDQIMNMVKSQLPPGSLDDNGATNVEMKVHMMPIGSPFPVPATANQQKSQGGGIPSFFGRGKNKAPPAAASKPKSLAEEPMPASITTTTTPATSKSESKSGTTGAGSRASLMSYFEELTVNVPRDHNLRIIWDRIIDDEISHRIIRSNTKLIMYELKRSSLRYAESNLKSVQETVRREMLTSEQVKQALYIAVKLQAGSQNYLSNSHMDASASSPELILSVWSLDAALNMVLKAPMPILGRPSSRSKDEINAMISDKHERALIGNIITPQDIGVTYDMIGGLHDVKEMLRQCITYPLKYPRLYQEGIAAEAVKGVLLFGPPGTGKTLLAKAVATEGGATFLTIDASTIENKWLGESEKNAKAVFTLARKLAPCVIYLDEVDSILSSREQGDDSSHGTLTSVKTTLMQEWDGLGTTKDRVVVIASTNRPFDLDEAVLRRLPRRILVDLPDVTTRQEILEVTLSGNRLGPDVNLTDIAVLLDGYTGSDVKEVCREAVVRVAHERAKEIEMGYIGKIADGYTSKSSSLPVDSTSDAAPELHVSSPLRPVSLADFKIAMTKLKASVDDTGNEMQKVVDWNDKYGEVKKKSKSNRAHLSMYI